MRIIMLLCILLCVTPSHAIEKPAKKGASQTDDRGLVVTEKNRDSRKRVALVIGNSSYASSPLKNPVNDAHAMASTLRRLGFEVDERTNLNYIPFNEAVENFGNKLKTGGIGLFYYAGHGMQVNGANYLIPVDAKINTENEVRYKAIDAGLVLAKMESAKSDVNIAIFDACRDNPFARSFRSASHGLAQVDAPTGTIIAYATAPGRTAADGDGKNGVYTDALIQAIESPGLKVEEVFKRVRKLVIEKTAYSQVPWESSSLVGDFHFIQPSSITDLKPSPLRPQPVVKTVVENAPIVQKSPDSELTYTDPATGLMWVKSGNIADKEMDWDGAMNWVKGLSYGGYNDWRLPTVEELGDFVKRGGTQPSEWLNANGFNNVLNGFYWTGSTSYNNYRAMRIHMYDGIAVDNFKPSRHNVWPVRTNQTSAVSKPALLSNSISPAPTTSRGFTEPTTGMEFVKVPGGCFQMGDTFGDGNSDEQPVHEACVSDFAIGKYEVTQGQWRKIMGHNPSNFSSCGDNCPVERVSWNDAQNFIRKLNSQTGTVFRLPTEAEWEYAARSGGKQEKYSGGDNVDEVAWYSGNSESKTHPVGQKQPNGLGIYDMSGNVLEWVNDWKGNYTSGRHQNPLEPPSNSSHMVRGGSWGTAAKGIRVANRDFNAPVNLNPFLGFRLASPVQ